MPFHFMKIAATEITESEITDTDSDVNDDSADQTEHDHLLYNIMEQEDDNVYGDENLDITNTEITKPRVDEIPRVCIK